MSLCEKKNKISPQFPPGSFTTIVGVSGSGERQLFSLIPTLFPENFQAFWVPTNLVFLRIFKLSESLPIF